MRKSWRKLGELGEKVEHYNAKLIPFALVVLAAIIIYELFLHYENHTLELAVKILDGLVIAVFVIDLIFLAVRAKNARFFFRNFWLDILAIFPFSLFFEMVNALYRVVVATERIAIGQAIAHETLEVSKEARVLSKSGKAARVIKMIARLVRIVTKSHFFTRFHHQRHGRKRKKRKEKTGKEKRQNKRKNRP